MRVETVIAFDPGLTVGTCVFEMCDGNIMQLSQSLHLHSVNAVEAFLHSISLDHQPRRVAVVAESFARGNSVVKEQILTLRMCGAIEALCAHFGFKHSEQFPASRTGYIPIAKCMIKELGFGTLQANHHAIDAIAHALCFMDEEGFDWQKQYWLRKALQ